MSLLSKISTGRRGRAQKVVIYAELSVGLSSVAKVSPEDFDRISQFRWHLTDKGYAATNIPIGNGAYKYGKMHRLVLGAEDGALVDHINGDKLDNRRENLRLASHSENARNAKKRRDSNTGFKGVSARNRGKKFQARITYGGARHSLGIFQTPEAAAEAYARAAMVHHGEFARIN